MELNEAMKALGLQSSPAIQVEAAATAATTVSDAHSDKDESHDMTKEGADIAKILLNDENGLLVKNMGLRKPDVLFIFLVGSRLWGCAEYQSDFDVIVVVRDQVPRVTTSFRRASRGRDIDISLTGMQDFLHRLADMRFLELACAMAPASCVLHASQALPAIKINPRAMMAALKRDFSKDWVRAKKLSQQQKNKHCKKILVHILRMHLLYLQIKTHGRITDYHAANPHRREISLFPSSEWRDVTARYEWELRGMQDMVADTSGGGGGGDGGGDGDGGAGAPPPLSLQNVRKQASYWFGPGSSANPAIDVTERPSDPVVRPSRPFEQGDLVTLGVISRPGYGRWSGCEGVVQMVVPRGRTQRVYVAIEGVNALVPVSAKKLSLRSERPPRGEAGACAATKVNNGSAKNYPSTPHLPFSPQVNADDTQIPSHHFTHHHPLLQEPIVITEKLDGGNCCLKDGYVYARTHGVPTELPWFDRVKTMYCPTYSEMRCKVEAHNESVRSGTLSPALEFREEVDLGDLELYGENMACVHSIRYDYIQHPFYLFAVRSRSRSPSWQSRAFVEGVGGVCGVPVVPAIYKGDGAHTLSEIKVIIEAAMKRPSALSRNGSVHPEGFVVRVTRGYEDSDFGRVVAKYVRKGHLQTVQNRQAFLKQWKTGTTKAEIHGQKK